MADQGIVDFPGLDTFSQAEYTNSQGITPGVCTIEMPLELIGELEPSGDLVFTYGDETVTIPDCVVDYGSVDTSLGANMARVAIKDRRWRWQFGEVSGHWNLPAPSPNVYIGNNDPPAGERQKVKLHTARQPQDLLSDCLDAMSETGYDVSQVPNDTLPEVHWSHANPAAAMAALCDSLGCRIVLDIDDSHVIIVPISQGQELPDNEFVTFPQEGLLAPITPSLLRLVGDCTLQQGFIELESVGLDIDGKVRVIADLGYKPQAGWEKEEPSRFPDVQVEPAKTVCHQTMYKWWRPKFPFTAPDGTQVEEYQQLILHDRMLDTYLALYSDQDSANITAAAEVMGWFNDLRTQAKILPNSNGAQLYRGSVSIDQERCLVITGDPLYSITDGSGGDASGGGSGPSFKPASLWLKTAFSVCDKTNREPMRYTRDRQMDTQNDTPPKIIRNEQVFLRVRGSYKSDSNSFQLSSTATNNDDGSIDQFADYFLDYAQKDYTTEDSFVITYARIQPIQLDGLVQQVTYSITAGPGGSAMTKASSNTEHNPYIPRYKVRRDRELAYDAQKKQNLVNSRDATQQVKDFDKAQG